MLPTILVCMKLKGAIGTLHLQLNVVHWREWMAVVMAACQELLSFLCLQDKSNNTPSSGQTGCHSDSLLESERTS